MTVISEQPLIERRVHSSGIGIADPRLEPHVLFRAYKGCSLNEHPLLSSDIFTFL